MKRFLQIICASICIFLCSCNNAEKTVSFEYSNMVDKETQDFVIELLNKHGVDFQDIDLFIECVNDFYNNYKGIADNGWVKTDLIDFGYTAENAFEHWDSKDRNRFDINCRVAAFILFKDFLSASNDSAINIVDENLLNEISLFTNQEIRKYSTVYGYIETNASKKNELINDIQSYRQHYGIEFDDDSPIKLLCLYTKSSGQSYAQIFHAAVMIEENDSLYLIEKYEPMYPYQISKFDSLDDLKSYILERCSPPKTSDIQYAEVMVNNEAIN